MGMKLYEHSKYTKGSFLLNLVFISRYDKELVVTTLGYRVLVSCATIWYIVRVSFPLFAIALKEIQCP